MTKEILEIQEIVDRETKAWNTQDIDLLISVFHPDMVWPHPRPAITHDTMDWELNLGSFDKKQWSKKWMELFDKYKLELNVRKIEKIEISENKDYAFAVVNIDTRWIDINNNDTNQWKGQVCKVYSKVNNEWKMTMHTILFKYL